MKRTIARICIAISLLLLIAEVFLAAKGSPLGPIVRVCFYGLVSIVASTAYLHSTRR